MVEVRRRLFPMRSREGIALPFGVVPLRLTTLSIGPAAADAASVLAVNRGQGRRRDDTRPVIVVFSLLWFILAAGLSLVAAVITILSTGNGSCDAIATVSTRLIMYLVIAIPLGLTAASVVFVAAGSLAWFHLHPWTYVCGPSLRPR